MSRSSTSQQKAVPAQVDFLAIYNPGLGTTDATLADQIVYYWTPKDTKKKTKSKTFSEREEQNERLRHVGLAQGMIEFAKTFSDGKPVDTVETEKSRVVLHEIEKDWWILASINLTRLPKASTTPAVKGSVPENEDLFEYSSREVKCSDLLIQDLRRAHSGFLFHHASTLRQLYSQNIKSKFGSLLRNYWDDFMSTWNVMLHGNPAVAIYGGIKLAGSGELGIGVGEEDRGSGEREVLEGFVGRIDGMVDLVVSRFGDAKAEVDDEKSSKQTAPLKDGPQQPWLGSGADPSHDDGAIFLGVGAVSRDSLQDVTHWMEDVYCWGPRAHGIMKDPNASSRQRKNADRNATRSEACSADAQASDHKDCCSPQGSLKKASPKRNRRSVNVVELHQNGTFHLKPVSSNDGTSEAADGESSAASDRNSDEATKKRSDSVSAAEGSGQASYMDYLKLGYGKHWSLGGVTGAASKTKEPETSDTPKLAPSPAFSIPRQLVPPSADVTKTKEPDVYYPPDDSVSHYLVGLLGDIEEPEDLSDTGNDGGPKASKPIVTTRTVMAAVSAADGSQAPPTVEKLCIVLYCNRPFMYALLFRPDTKALFTTSLYRSLHYQLSPLQRPLLSSTSNRLGQPRMSTTTLADARSPIHHLVWDPKQQIISSTLPNIPSPHNGHENSRWTRLEALNTHTQILNTFAATREDAAELERTCKTSRNHWIVWTRLPDPESKDVAQPDSRSGSATPTDSETRPSTATSQMSHGRRRSTSVSVTADKEIWLVRKAGDGSGRSGGDEKQGLARGIGVDTRLYIDELLRSMQ